MAERLDHVLQDSVSQHSELNVDGDGNYRTDTKAICSGNSIVDACLEYNAIDDVEKVQNDEQKPLKEPLLLKQSVTSCLEQPTYELPITEEPIYPLTVLKDTYKPVSDSGDDIDSESGTESSLATADPDACFIANMDIDSLVDKESNKRTRNKSDQIQLRKKPKDKRPEPNSFVAIPITSTVIREGLEKVQGGIVEHNKQLKKVLTSMKKLHITLMVIRMETEEDIIRGKRALHEASELIRTSLEGKPIVLKFAGLRYFGNKPRVVFADVVDGLSELKNIADIARKVFRENGLQNTDKRKSFNPHATIAKVSKTAGRIKYIPIESFSSSIDTEFGTEIVTNIELLSMTAPPTDNGYYFCYHRVKFTS